MSKPHLCTWLRGADFIQPCLSKDGSLLPTPLPRHEVESVSDLSDPWHLQSRLLLSSLQLVSLLSPSNSPPSILAPLTPATMLSSPYPQAPVVSNTHQLSPPGWLQHSHRKFHIKLFHPVGFFFFTTCTSLCGARDILSGALQTGAVPSWSSQGAQGHTYEGESRCCSEHPSCVCVSVYWKKHCSLWDMHFWNLSVSTPNLIA